LYQINIYEFVIWHYIIVLQQLTKKQVNALFASMLIRDNMKEGEFVYRKNYIELSNPEHYKYLVKAIKD